MKRVISLLLTLVLLCTLVPAALGADEEATAAADVLNALGLFNGTGTGEDGRPIYDLDRAPTRSEAVTMLVRMLGKEAEAKAGTWETPFTDLNWAAPYVGYAYAMGYTNGVSETEFGSASLITAAQYLTFVLRALGYESGKDFRWDAAWELTDELGVTHGEYSGENNAGFLRGDVVQVSAAALSAKMKDAPFTLAEKLMGEGVFTAEQYAAATGTAAGPGEFDPNSPENLALYTFEYDPDQDGYVITDTRRTAENLMDSPYCSFPDEYQGKPVVEIRAIITTPAEVIVIPASIRSITKPFENINSCREFVVAEDNPAYCAVDGVLMNKAQTELIRYPTAKPTETYRIPDTVTAVCRYAFRGGYGDRKLDIYIPAGVRYLDQWVFNCFACKNMTIHVEGSTAGWNPGCFYSFGTTSLHIEGSSSFSAFRPLDTYVRQKGDSNVTFTSIDYAENGDMAVIRLQYEKSSDNYARGFFTVLDTGSGSIEGFSGLDSSVFALGERRGEYVYYLPRDVMGNPCGLVFNWKPNEQDQYTWGEDEVIWLFPGGLPDWVKQR